MVDTTTTLDRLGPLQRVWWLAPLLVLAGLPLAFPNQGTLRVLTLTCIWTGLAISWNIFTGYSGYLSLGHSLYFGIGALTSTILLVEYQLSPWIGMAVGAVLAAIAAVILGFALLRFSGIHFALATISVPLAVIPILIWSGFIEIAIPFNPQRPHYFMSYRGLTPLYYISAAFLVFVFLISVLVDRRPIGYYLKAINDSEPAAESLGIDTTWVEVKGLTLSAVMASFFGTIYVQATFVITPEQVFGVTPIIYSIIIPIFGGLGTLWGPVVGGFALYPLTNLLRSNLGDVLPGINNLVLGLLLILIVIYLPEGIYTSLREKFLTRTRTSGQETEPEGGD